MLAAALLTLLPLLQAQAPAPDSAASAIPAASPEALKAAILRGDSAKYQCGYAQPRGEALGFEGLCPGKGREGRALTPLHVTLGWPDNPNYFQPDASDGIPDGLFITRRSRLVAATLLGLLIIGGYAAALLQSDIFRIGARLDTGERQAHSFAPVQWGVWTTFALASAVFLWAVYGVFMPLSEQILSLMGKTYSGVLLNYRIGTPLLALPESGAVPARK